MSSFLKRFLLFLSPFFALLVLYFVWDPFRVVYHHSPYYEDGDFICINRGYVSTKTYNELKEKYEYDSFIFGNSRSLAFRVSEWKRYLPDSSSCFHFDASGGSVLGLYEKVAYIDRCGGTVKNAIFVIDDSLLDRFEITGHLFDAAPCIKSNHSIKYWLLFHIDNICVFFTPKFLLSIIDYSIFRTRRPYMGLMVDDRTFAYELVPNELWNERSEDDIINDNYYTEDRMRVFENAQFPDDVSECHLDDDKISILYQIRAILDKHNTSYRIIVSPLYNQIKMSPQSRYTLCEIFGDENVYDFSGPNKWNADYHNYYESSHYRPCVADDIMRIIYEKESNQL